MVKNEDVYAPCNMSIYRRTDSKFESHLHIIETKCVSEFEDLNVLGEENRFVEAFVYTNTV